MRAYRPAMADATDVRVVEEIYTAMATQDLEAIIARVSPAIVITQDARLPWGGRFEGLEGFAAFAAALTGTITSTVTHDAVFATDTEVVQVGRTRGTVVATGAGFDIPEVHRWTLRDGLAVAAHFSIDTGAMLGALAADG